MDEDAFEGLLICVALICSGAFAGLPKAAVDGHAHNNRVHYRPCRRDGRLVTGVYIEQSILRPVQSEKFPNIYRDMPILEAMRLDYTSCESSKDVIGTEVVGVPLSSPVVLAYSIDVAQPVIEY